MSEISDLEVIHGNIYMTMKYYFKIYTFALSINVPYIFYITTILTVFLIQTVELSERKNGYLVY